MRSARHYCTTPTKIPEQRVKAGPDRPRKAFFKAGHGAPAIHDVVIAQYLDLPRAQLKHEVVMIVHDGIGADVYGKERGEQSNPVDDPLSPMFIILSRVVIDPTQEGAAHAA